MGGNQGRRERIKLLLLGYSCDRDPYLLLLHQATFSYRYQSGM